LKKINFLIYVILFGVSFISKPVFADIIHACKIIDETQFNGVLYRVGFTVPTCAPKHEVISWNQTGPGATQFVLKGITNTKATGDEGMGRFSQLCAEEVDPNSRFCTSKEVLQSINPFPSPLAEPIWVHPESLTIADYTAGG